MPPLSRLSSLRGAEEFLIDCWQDAEIGGWWIDGLPVWPLICHALNTLLLEREALGHSILAERALGRLALAAHYHAGPVRSRMRLSSRLPQMWARGETVFFASRSAFDPATLTCRTTDAIRMELAEIGSRTRLLLVDTDEQFAGLADAEPVAGIASQLKRLRQRSSRYHADLPGFERWLASIHDLTGLAERSLHHWFARLFGHLSAYHKAFGHMLDSDRPARIILTDHGDAFAAGLSAAAKERGVPVICIQHGVLRRCDPEHPLHPHRDLQSSTYPSSHLVWRDRNLGKQDQPVGPLSVHLAFSQRFDIPEPSDRPTMLVAPQSRADAHRIVSVLSAVRRQISILWRPHPRLGLDWTANGVQQHLYEGSSVARDDGPLALSLLRADLLITGYSATAIEAAALYVPTLFLSDYARWIMPDQIDPDLCHFNAEAASGQIETLPRVREDGITRMQMFSARYGEAKARAIEVLSTAPLAR